MSADRIPPHDLDAEGAVLSAVMLDGAALDAVFDILKPDQFYAEAHRRIAEAAIDLRANGKPVDVVTVAGVLRDRDRLSQIGGAAYLAQLAGEVPAVAHVGAYANRVLEKSRLRELGLTCGRISAECYGPIDDVAEFVDRAERDVFAIAQRDERRDLVSLEDVLREAHRAMLANEARAAGAVEIPTGLTALDRLMGGLGRGGVTVIAARPGMGKTALATTVAATVAREVGPVVVFSLEMPRAQLAMRMACAEAGANAQRGIKGRLHDAERVEVLRVKDTLRKLPIWIDDSPGLGLMQIRSRARAAVAKAGRRLGLVAIDYLQLMRGRRDRGGTRDQELSEITRGVKELAKDLDCPVILLSQLNRQCEEEKDKRPHLRHLRESGGIEQDADDVVFVYRDEYYDPASKSKGVAELIVAKQRNGPTGTVRVAFYGRSTSFADLLTDDHITHEAEED